VSAWTYPTDDRDLARLFSLLRDKSQAGRETLTRIIDELFEGDGDTLSERERVLMTDMLRQLVHGSEMAIRNALANRLAEHRDERRDLVYMLADERIELAYPILVDCAVLHDGELIERVRQRTLQHQLGIAGRRRLARQIPEAITDVEGEGDTVVSGLLESPHVDIAEATLAYLAEQSARLDSYQNPMLSPTDLSRPLLHRLLWSTAAALRRHVIEGFKVEPTDFDDHVEASVHQALIAQRSGSSEGNAAERLAVVLSRAAPIQVEMLLRLLREGEVALFEPLFTLFTGLPPRLARRMVYEPGGEALAITCRAAGFDTEAFVELFEITRSARGAARRDPTRPRFRLIALYDEIPQPAAEKVLRSLCRDHDYLEAIYRLSQEAVPRRRRNPHDKAAEGD
jgi:uncharacterized protein (DUF2336 family)